MELSSETRVTELQQASPAMLKALTGTGLFREGDDPDVTINQLCWNAGLNPVIILNMLAEARAGEAPDEIDVSELDGLGLTAIIENIEASHHVFLRELMPRIGSLLNEVAGAGDTRLVALQELFAHMADELEGHMQHEEESLFVLARDMDAAGATRPTRCGDKVAGPILCMENDHAETRRQLAKLRELAGHYHAPAGASAAFVELLELLRQFDDNTVVHMYKEDRVLFPLALERERELRS